MLPESYGSRQHQAVTRVANARRHAIIGIARVGRGSPFGRTCIVARSNAAVWIGGHMGVCRVSIGWARN